LSEVACSWQMLPGVVRSCQDVLRVVRSCLLEDLGRWCSEYEHNVTLKDGDMHSEDSNLVKNIKKRVSCQILTTLDNSKYLLPNPDNSY